MKKLAIVFAAAAIFIAGCSSTEDPSAAPIGSTKPSASGGAAGSGAAGGGAQKPPSLTVGQNPSGGVDPALKQGMLGQRSVYFEFDSNEISEKYRPMLQAHAGYLSKNTSAKMLVQGNTDERGSREYNLALGQRRSDSIKRMLVLMGARDAQIETVSFGEEKPKRSGSSEADYAENRRGDMMYGGEF